MVLNNDNFSKSEKKKFDEQANMWWDKSGPMSALHKINPIRVEFIKASSKLNESANVLDVGCGGGILTEDLAKKFRHVNAIDISDSCIKTAKQHAKDNSLIINYEISTIEQYICRPENNKFDLITCMEMLEHVPNPQQIVTTCANACNSGGYVFFSTINRNIKSFCLGIIAAEYIMKFCPAGTHNYAKFIKPSELINWAKEANLNMVDMIGISYNPFKQEFFKTTNVDVNYIICFKKA